jgi:hemoglobin/transferrin/lactoferrin receptor protein
MGYSISRALLRASASTLAIVFLQAAPGFAPAASAQTIGLDTVEVTSTKTEEKAIDSLAAVSTVRTEQMDALQPDRISEMFFDVPGIWFSQELGTDPAATAINIRGLQDFGRVAVIVDGARRAQPRFDRLERSAVSRLSLLCRAAFRLRRCSCRRRFPPPEQLHGRSR